MTLTMRKKLSLAVATITLASSVSANQLADLYQQARSYDAQLLSAQAQGNAALQDDVITKAELLPRIDLTGSVSDNNGNRISNGVEVPSSVELSLIQPLFDLSKFYSYQRAKTLSESAKISLSLAEQDLIQRLVTSYLDILSAKGTLEVAESRERALSRRLDQVNAQFDVGLIAITDVLEARASYDDARVGLIDAKGALSNSFEAMERISGAAIKDIAPLSADYPITGLSVSDTEQWVAKALKGNLGLKRAALNETAATQQLEASKALALPTLEFSAALNQSESSFSGDSGGSTLGMRLKVPLYRGGATTAGERKAEYQAAQRQYEYDDALREVTQSTRSLVRDIQTSVASVEARMKSIESRETALEATEQGFEVGTRNVVDVLDAENALFVARQNYIDARLGHIKLQFALKQTVGTLSPEDIVTLDNWLK